MLTRIEKWGLRLPMRILKEAGIEVGDELQVSVIGRSIILEPVNKPRRKYDLKKLIAKMPENYNVKEIKWGPPVGKEIW